jgi:hypothetical protein
MGNIRHKKKELFVKHISRVDSYDDRFCELIIKIRHGNITSPAEFLKVKQ